MKSLFVCLFSFLAVITYCQVPKPVKWTFDIEVKNGSTAQFKAVATIEKGWNIYSVYMSDEGPIPTAFNFDKVDGASMDGKIVELSKSIKTIDPLFDMEVIKFKEEAIFTQGFKDVKGLKIKGSVIYMCCDSNRCLPPTSELFSLSL